MPYTYLVSEHKVGSICSSALCVSVHLFVIFLGPHGPVVVGAIESWKVRPHPSCPNAPFLSISAPFQSISDVFLSWALCIVHLCALSLRLQAKFGKCPWSGAREVSASVKQALHSEASSGWLKHHGPRLALQVGLGEKSEKSKMKQNEANQHNDIRHHPTYSACIARMFKASMLRHASPCVWRTLEYQASNVPPLSELVA